MSASWIDCARSESIFCWPRAFADFFREECFFEDAVVVFPEDLLVPAEEGFVEWGFGDVFLAVVDLAEGDFAAWAPESESWRALATGTRRQPARSAVNAPMAVFRIPAKPIKSKFPKLNLET